MITLKRFSPGMSLVELVVTLVIGIIFFMMVGMIIVYSQDSWFRSKQVADSLNEYQYTSRRLNYLVRQGSTDAFPSNSSLPQNNLQTWTFSVYDRPSSSIQYNQIALEGTSLVRNYGPSAINMPSKEVLMRNVNSLDMTVDTNFGTVNLQVEQSVPASNINKAGRITKTRTIKIRRNKTFTRQEGT